MRKALAAVLDRGCAYVTFPRHLWERETKKCVAILLWKKQWNAKCIARNGGRMAEKIVRGVPRELLVELPWLLHRAAIRQFLSGECGTLGAE